MLYQFDIRHSLSTISFDVTHEPDPLWIDVQDDSSSDVIARNGLWIDVQFDEFLHKAHLDSIDRLFAEDLGQQLDKEGLAHWRQRRRITLAAGKSKSGEPVILFLKRFDSPPMSARRLMRAAGLAAKSVAGVEWLWLRRLRAEKIPCPTALALGEEFDGGREVRSALLTLAVPGDALERQMPRWHEFNSKTRRGIIAATARLVSRFHRKGFVHRDLYLSHIFFDPASPLDSALHLIDLQRVLRPRWRKSRWIVKDLASLNFSAPHKSISRADRLRWLLTYLDVPKLDERARRLAYLVMGKTRRVARRERQRKATRTEVRGSPL